MNREDRDRLERDYTPLVIEGIRPFYSSGHSTDISSQAENAIAWVFFNCFFDDDIPGTLEADPWSQESVLNSLDTYIKKCKPLQYKHLIESWEWVKEGSDKEGSDSAGRIILSRYYPEAVVLGESLLLRKTRRSTEIRNRLSIDIDHLVMSLFERNSTPLRNYKALGSVAGLIFTTLANRIRKQIDILIKKPHVPLFDGDKPIRTKPWVRLDRERLLRALIDGLQKLDENQRRLIIDYYFERMTQEQCARERGVDTSTVCRWLKESYTPLKKSLLDRGFDKKDVGVILEETTGF
jgi:RNA polymerase sigma factor (sigma-70 family)